jgi:uncharacterized protein (UPF0335 family)
MAKIGHNSKATKPATVSADRLKSFVERIERLEEERVAIASDIKDIYTEAKSIGYDVGTMRKVIRLRGMDAADRAEQQALLDTYMHALGMIDRIDARLAAGESQRQIAEAENVSKSTVQRRGPKLDGETASSKTDRHNPETGEITETADAALRAEAPFGIPQIAGVIPPSVKPDPECREGSGTYSDDMPDQPAFLRRAGV